MRRISMGAAESKHLLPFDYVDARNWIIFAISGLLLGVTEIAAAAQTQREVHFSSYDDSLIAGGGGPYVAPRTPADPADVAAVTSTTPEASPVFNGAEYWDALSGLNLSVLRSTAVGDAQQEFARGMSLLADGETESAEGAFIAGSEQRSDLTVGIAS